MKHFLADHHCSQKTLLDLIELGIKIKQSPEQFNHALSGKSVVMLFEKPSLRTHISFDVGIQKLGGHSLYLGQQNGHLGERERIKDLAQNLACWCDAIVARVYKQSVLDEMAEHGSIPVINALSDLYHPCQALADYMTLTEQFGSLSGLNFAYVGDANNVSNSLMFMGAILGVNVSVICPEGHQPDTRSIVQAKQLAEQHQCRLTISSNIDEIGEQDVIYTDTWVSMGDSKSDQTLAKFLPFQVNENLMAKTKAAKVMHCQPAHMEQEISQAVFDSPQSLAMIQAENRMWAQNAVLLTLLK
ncbi:ornithine carbamoyltransferase [Thalassotalea aquiviva]|uniref:ornithine carbamoyltransferase n=1 Tax=Thalassotalea aquiviva TaxID=3242415 RepID=UPI00352B9955